MGKITLLILLVVLNYAAFSQAEKNNDSLSANHTSDFAQTNKAAVIDLACDHCKEPAVKIAIPVASGITVYSNNLLYFKQLITVNTSPLKYIKSIKAELTYFEAEPESDECFKCNRNSVTFGNFDACTLSAINGVGTGTHSMAWVFMPPKMPAAFTGIFNITLPPSVKCCSIVFHWCIRYVFEFDDCSVCSKMVCYEKKKSESVDPPASNLPNPTVNPIAYREN